MLIDCATSFSPQYLSYVLVRLVAPSSHPFTWFPPYSVLVLFSEAPQQLSHLECARGC